MNLPQNRCSHRQATSFEGTASRTCFLRRHVKLPPRASPDLRCRATQRASTEAQKALETLKEAIKGTSRGLNTPSGQKSRILDAVASLQKIGEGSLTTGPDIDGTWKMLWTTEKETLFILKNAKITGTEAGDVFQVIDTRANQLQNVITFKNGASFVVDSSLQEGGEQRLVFKFTAARLNLPKKTWKIPPFGKGWFDTVYLDADYRVAKDIRGDTLVVQRDGPPRSF